MGSLAGTLTAEPATSAEAVLAEMLADVMKVEQVPLRVISSTIWARTRW